MFTNETLPAYIVREKLYSEVEEIAIFNGAHYNIVLCKWLVPLTSTIQLLLWKQNDNSGSQ